MVKTTIQHGIPQKKNATWALGRESHLRCRDRGRSPRGPEATGALIAAHAARVQLGDRAATLHGAPEVHLRQEPVGGRGTYGDLGEFMGVYYGLLGRVFPSQDQKSSCRSDHNVKEDSTNKMHWVKDRNCLGGILKFKGCTPTNSGLGLVCGQLQMIWNDGIRGVKKQMVNLENKWWIWNLRTNCCLIASPQV